MRISLLLTTLLSAAALCSATTQANVEVEATQHTRLGTVLAAKVSEDIAPGDYEALLKGLRAHPGKFASKIVLLDTIGGSAPEAMRMGRLLRETGFDVLVPATGVCQGSCIYLLAAGKRKTVRGYVGLHRPYFPSGDSARAQAAHHGERYNPAAYFRTMHVATRLAADLQHIDPHQLRVLTAEELAGYGLK
jgi:hypothetical protein